MLQKANVQAVAWCSYCVQTWNLLGSICAKAAQGTARARINKHARIGVELHRAWYSTSLASKYARFDLTGLVRIQGAEVAGRNTSAYPYS